MVVEEQLYQVVFKELSISAGTSARRDVCRAKLLSISRGSNLRAGPASFRCGWKWSGAFRVHCLVSKERNKVTPLWLNRNKSIKENQIEEWRVPIKLRATVGSCQISYTLFMSGCVDLVDDKLDHMLWKAVASNLPW